MALALRPIMLLTLLSAFAGVGPARADEAAVAEADRLFSAAMARWDWSMSPEVEDMLLRALRLRKASLAETDPRVLEAEDRLGRVHWNRAVSGGGASEFGLAERFFAEAEAGMRASASRDEPAMSDYLGDHAAALRETGRLEEALPRVCESLMIRRSLQPADPSKVAASLDNLARIKMRQGRGRDAGRLGRDAEKVRAGGADDEDRAGAALDRFCRPAPVS